MAAQNPPYVIQGQSHPADGFRRAVKALREAAGVILAGDMAVVQNGSPNMSVNVGAGQAVIDGTENATLQGSYEVTNDATVNLAIAASDPTNPRNDLVVAKVQDSNYSGGAQTWSLAVVTGTPSGSPVDPATPSNAIVLARVRVDATVTSIVNAKITDLRPFLHGSIFPGQTGFTLWDSTGALKQAATDDNGLWTYRNALQIPYAKDTALPATSYGTVPLKFAETLLGGTAASVSFTSIPGAFRNLRASIYAREDAAVASDLISLRFNNDSAANYDSERFGVTAAAYGTPVESVGNGVLIIGVLPGGTATANYFGQNDIVVKHYAGTTGNKIATCEAMFGDSNLTAHQAIYKLGGKWRTTATAINRMDFLPGAGNFVAGSFLSIQLEP